MAAVKELLITMAKNLEDDDSPAFRRNLEEFNRLRQKMLEHMTDAELIQKMSDLRAKMSDNTKSHSYKQELRHELNGLLASLERRIRWG